MSRKDYFFFIFVCLFCFSVGFFSRPRQTVITRESHLPYDVQHIIVTNEVLAVHNQAIGVSVERDTGRKSYVTVEYQPFKYICTGDDSYVLAGGKKYAVGYRLPDGVVTDVNHDFIRVVGVDGWEHYIYALDTAALYSSDARQKKDDDASAASRLLR